MDKEQAIKATKQGAIAAVVSGVLTLGVTLFAVMTDDQGDLEIWNDPANFFDAVFVFVCAFFMYRKSRAASVIMLVYFVVAKIVIAISLERVPGIFLSVIFVYYFARATQGAFVFHRIEQEDNPDYRPAPKWYYFAGIPLVLILFAFMSIGFMSMVGVIPSTEVLAGDKVPKHQKEALIHEGIIDEGESVEYFYSQGLMSIMEDGNLLTDQRVISYFMNESGEMEIYELYLDEISDIQLISEGDFLSDSLYQVNGFEEDKWLQIYLSKEMDGDQDFVSALQEKIENQK